MKEEYWPPDKVKVSRAACQVRQATLKVKLPFSPTKSSPRVIDLRDYQGCHDKPDSHQAPRVAFYTAVEIEQRTKKVLEAINKVNGPKTAVKPMSDFST